MAERRTNTTTPREITITEWYGRLEDAPVFPNLEYWQSQPPLKQLIFYYQAKKDTFPRVKTRGPIEAVRAVMIAAQIVRFHA